MTMRDWTPRHLPGDVYCSPGCGMSCTRADFERVTNEAAALAAHLGDGWGPEVWENCGWHYRVNRRQFEIYKDSDGTFHASYQGDKQFFATAQTPEDALGFVVQDVRTFVRRIEDDLS